MRLRFSCESALEVALGSGLVPESEQAHAVSYARLDDGSVVVDPGRTLSAAQTRALVKAGVTRVDAKSGAKSGAQTDAPMHEAPCWPAIVRTTSAPIDELAVVLFELPNERLLELAGELLRLGCDRMQWARTEDRAWLRAEAPPFYTVARVGERGAGLRAFVPCASDERVWIEVGRTHPLLARVRPADGATLFVDRDDRWRSAPTPTFEDALGLFEIVASGEPMTWASLPRGTPLRVPLRLGRGLRAHAPSLWVIRHHALARLEALALTTPEEVAEGLLFAIAGTPAEPVVILRARPGSGFVASLDGEAYAPLAALPEVLAPPGATIEPPLRATRLREVLLGDEGADGTLVWLAPLGEGRFRVERIAEHALTPLSEWTVHETHAAAAVLEPWVASVTFALGAFESIGAEWSDPRPTRTSTREEPEETERPRRTRAKAVESSETVSTPRAVVVPAALVRAAEAPTTIDATDDETADDELADLEATLQADVLEPEPWMRLAALYAAEDRADQAGLCIARAAWELQGEELASVLRRGLAMERERLHARHLGALVTSAVHSATYDAGRALAFALALAPLDPTVLADLRPLLPRVAAALRARADSLDVRSVWLAERGLAAITGDDRLGLARARDRVLERVREGLSATRDLPAFLRFETTTPSSDATRASEHVAALHEHLVTTERKRSALEAPESATFAYVAFEAAFAHARLGDSERASSCRGRALDALDLRDVVHGHLARTYGARIEQALAGRTSGAPLPEALVAEREALDAFVRYKIDRLREASAVLEPHARPDPIRRFARKERDPRDELQRRLEGEESPSELDRRLALWLAEHRDGDYVGALAALLAVAPGLPAAVVLPRLDAILDALADLPLAPRTLLLDQAILVALGFDRPALAERAAELLRAPLSGLDADEAASVASEIGAGLSALASAGLEEHAVRLLSGLAARATRDDVPSLVARARLAGELAAIGDAAEAEPLLAGARTKLRDPSMTMPDRLRLTRAIASAAGRLPTGAAAIAQLAEQTAIVTDSYNTNSHYCLSLVELADTLFLGHAHEGRSAGARARRELEREAERVRRRVHADLAGGTNR